MSSTPPEPATPAGGTPPPEPAGADRPGHDPESPGRARPEALLRTRFGRVVHRLAELLCDGREELGAFARFDDAALCRAWAEAGPPWPGEDDRAAADTPGDYGELPRDVRVVMWVLDRFAGELEMSSCELDEDEGAADAPATAGAAG